MTSVIERVKDRIRACWQAQLDLHHGYVNHYVMSGREAAAALEARRRALHWSDDHLVGDFVPDPVTAARLGDDTDLWR